ncbi:type II toxin-antitoxin system VapC family toxin [Azospirillum halopraeferens]|uniref:type II toxin-antitoxin system VapC family toxin n=1 Tax=Azospirillum halopraeferens TaxID=34010 RepID=UPI00041A53B7|nr:PIN domain nuclease [Azospirillum halopraeferens]
MILVDSSVWIANLRGLETPTVRTLRTLTDPDRLLVGDLILIEVLQGARSDAHAERIERNLRQFTLVPLLDGNVPVRAARNYRALRERGVTVRKTIDVIIGTYCIENGCALLHDDRDFLPMQEHLGLRSA